MGLKRYLLALLLVPLVLTGCKSVITNLTPQRYARSTNDLYHFEMQWDSRQQSLVADSLKPYVVIGTNFHSMDRVPVVANRWETLIPVPPGEKLVHYRYKVDYQYLAIPDRQESSRLSPPYRLEITDK